MSAAGPTEFHVEPESESVPTIDLAILNCRTALGNSKCSDSDSRLKLNPFKISKKLDPFPDFDLLPLELPDFREDFDPDDDPRLVRLYRPPDESDLRD